VLSDSLVEGSETFSVLLSNAANGTLADATGVGTIVDRAVAPQPLPTLSINDVTVAEGNAQTQAVFTVSLSAASATSVTVAYATAADTAGAGSDFLARSGVLTFAPGVTSLTITVPIVGDTQAESNETFRLVLSNPAGATLAKATGSGTIADNDAPSGGAIAKFVVTDDWGTGFVAGMTITNLSAMDINDWTIEFDFDRQITNIWNATITSRVGNHYVIRAESWNKKIGANGGSVSFGFQGTTGNVLIGPMNTKLNGALLS
jgi:chitinase